MFKRRRLVLIVNPKHVDVKKMSEYATLPIIEDFEATPSIQVKRV